MFGRGGAGEWVKGMGLGFTDPVGTGACVGGVGGGSGSERVCWCYVCVTLTPLNCAPTRVCRKSTPQPWVCR